MAAVCLDNNPLGTMSSDQQSSSSSGDEENETWDTKWTDFTLVVDTGEELKCHKMVLAKFSTFFQTMLKTSCEETAINKMHAKHFSLETVTTYLEYLYADLEWLPDQDLYRRKFDKTQITPELMKMCHIYETNSLHEECLKYLMGNICEDNAVDIWIEAERCENQDLKDLAMEFIAMKKGDICNIPGMEEAYSRPKMMKNLVDYCAARMDEDHEEETINIKVVLDRDSDRCHQVEVSVKPSDTVGALKFSVIKMRANEHQRKTNPNFRIFLSADKSQEDLKDDRKLTSYDIQDGSYLVMTNY